MSLRIPLVNWQCAALIHSNFQPFHSTRKSATWSKIQCLKAWKALLLLLRFSSELQRWSLRNIPPSPKEKKNKGRYFKISQQVVPPIEESPSPRNGRPREPLIYRIHSMYVCIPLHAPRITPISTLPLCENALLVTLRDTRYICDNPGPYIEQNIQESFQWKPFRGEKTGKSKKRSTSKYPPIRRTHRRCWCILQFL